MKKYLFLLFAVLAIVSCGKKKYSDLTYEFKGHDIYAFDEGKPYDGEVWSDDGKSIMLRFSTGILKEVCSYAEDGWLAIKESEDGETYYNQKGEVITRSQFKELYGAERKRIKRISREMEDHMKKVQP